jgi:hypothetical protein
MMSKEALVKFQMDRQDGEGWREVVLSVEPDQDGMYRVMDPDKPAVELFAFDAGDKFSTSHFSGPRTVIMTNGDDPLKVATAKLEELKEAFDQGKREGYLLALSRVRKFTEAASEREV